MRLLFADADVGQVHLIVDHVPSLVQNIQPVECFLDVEPGVERVEAKGGVRLNDDIMPVHDNSPGSQSHVPLAPQTG